MMKEGKFKEDSASVLSTQLHVLTVRKYLNQEKQTRKPAPRRSKPRPRREAKYYRRLGWMMKAFPVLVGVACALVLWDSQRQTERYHVRELAALRAADALSPGTLSARIPAPDRGLSEDTSLSTEGETSLPRSRSSVTVVRPSQALLMSADFHAETNPSDASGMSGSGLR